MINNDMSEKKKCEVLMDFYNYGVQISVRYTQKGYM